MLIIKKGDGQLFLLLDIPIKEKRIFDFSHTELTKMKDQEL